MTQDPLWDDTGSSLRWYTGSSLRWHRFIFEMTQVPLWDDTSSSLRWHKFLLEMCQVPLGDDKGYSIIWHRICSDGFYPPRSTFNLRRWLLLQVKKKTCCVIKVESYSISISRFLKYWNNKANDIYLVKFI